VAGLTIDILLDENRKGRSGAAPEELQKLLEAPPGEEPEPASCDLREVLENLSAMYHELGVEIHAHGMTDFSMREQEALCAVLKEALANAVRHAYARHIDLLLFEDTDQRGMVIRNGCLDEEPAVTEGRGLHDMKTRVRRAGGSVTYKKGDTFELQAVFPGEPLKVKEAVAL
jgi:signal transduction histidine kinase